MYWCANETMNINNNGNSFNIVNGNHKNGNHTHSNEANEAYNNYHNKLNSDLNSTVSVINTSLEWFKIVKAFFILPFNKSSFLTASVILNIQRNKKRCIRPSSSTGDLVNTKLYKFYSKNFNGYWLFLSPMLTN